MTMISSVEFLVNALVMLLTSVTSLVNAFATLISSVACLVNALAALISAAALLVEALARMPGDITAIVAALMARDVNQATKPTASPSPLPMLLLEPTEMLAIVPTAPTALDASATTEATISTALVPVEAPSASLSSESPKRRCVVIMSTYAHIRVEAVAAKRWIVDGLKNLGVRVTELELDAVEHRVLFKKYRTLSQSTQYPLVFLEDEQTGRNRVFLEHSRIEQHIHNIGMTEKQLDETHVPNVDRPSHIYRDAVKFKHGIIQAPNPHWNVRMEGKFEERERANDQADQAAEAALMAMEDHSA